MPLDDPLDNLLIPSDEQVTQGGMWVVEFFPPSLYSDLHDALDANRWDENNHLRAIDGTNSERVTQARRGQKFGWTKIGTIANPGSGYFLIDKQEHLPDEFSLIEVTAVHIGPSLTAVVAFIQLSDHGKNALNSVWKAQHEPTLTWQGLRPPHVEDRHFAAINATQRERQRMHDLGRSWLAERCGGYFATTKTRQPVVDFSLFKNFDPTSGRPSQEIGEALRALGMEGDHLYNFISPQLPGAVFVRGEALRQPDVLLRNCWGVVGNYDTFAGFYDDDGFGTKPYSVSTFAHIADDMIRSFLLHTAVLEYTRQLRETFSDARDTARKKHHKFKPSQLDKLRQEMLTTSLDLPVVSRDTALLWKRRYPGDFSVKAVPIPGIPRPPDEFDFIEYLSDQRTDAFDKLLEEDVAYRDVLSTASALGSSAASARLGRRALFVSVTSLAVSATTILTANGAAVWHLTTTVLITSGAAVWQQIAEWL
ncbi:hypothetical protein CH278_15205 [Rhodococcus sp. 05-2254-5]|nr:hypothetical protein CH278_15205 [Rhodococcus sp. 05-2254-5]OZE59595.1 hypothetical protein CH269_06990 [Rhodococcus sp. 05-2254-1]